MINATINSLTAESNESAAPFIWLQNSEKIKIQNTSPLGKTAMFLKAENSEQIVLINNELSLSNNSIETYKKTKKKIIKINNF